LYFFLLLAVSRGSQWSGRPCCPLALSSRCQNSCATASSRGELQHGCRQSDEQNLFSCLDRQEAGEECCGNARSSECLQVMLIFLFLIHLKFFHLNLNIFYRRVKIFFVVN